MPKVSPQRSFVALCSLAFVLTGAPVLANDTSVAIGVGGLTATVSDTVTMASEELILTPYRVRVRYEFRNVGTEPATMIVAFPLPALNLEELYPRPVDYPFPADQDFVGFHVTVDGKPVTPAMETKASFKGKDVTALLTSLKTPLTPQPNLSELPKATLQKLHAAGLISDPPTHPDDFLAPLWTVRTQFYWTQTFPVGASVVVEHSYRPVVGLGWFSKEDLGPGPGPDGEPPLAKSYCLDAADRPVVADRIKRSPAAGLSAQWMDYILTTARNWRGPIGRFKLTVEAAAPDHLLVSCLPGLRKSAPGRLTLEAANYVPPRDLAVMTLAPGIDSVPDGQLIGDSHYRLLDKAELLERYKDKLRLARNEIYARRGFIFDSADMRDYFSKMKWYEPRSKSVVLNAIEQANVRTIQDLEK